MKKPYTKHAIYDEFTVFLHKAESTVYRWSKRFFLRISLK